MGTDGVAKVAVSAATENTIKPSAANPNPPLIIERSRSNENRYGRRNRSRYVDQQTWNEKCKDVYLAGFFPQNEAPTPHDTLQALRIKQSRLEVPFTQEPEPRNFISFE